MGPEAAGKVVGEKRVKMRLRRWAVPAALMAFLIIAGVLGIYNFYFRLPPVATASDAKMPSTLPKGPSIAVLPFVNMSGDPEQDYFSDGLTENIITGISACPKLFVIARNSTFTYKGRPVKIQQVARELGVQYVLEGSVQKAGGRVRITAQLIDATTGHHVWAEKYDRDLKDIFALQDEITIMIMTALEVKLTEGEQARLRLRGPGNLEAFMKVLKAVEYFRRHNKEDNVLARQEIKEVIAIAPEHSGSHALLAMTHLMDLWYGTEHPFISVALASKSTRRSYRPR